jgi:hypothetical protein
MTLQTITHIAAAAYIVFGSWKTGHAGRQAIAEPVDFVFVIKP